MFYVYALVGDAFLCFDIALQARQHATSAISHNKRDSTLQARQRATSAISHNKRDSALQACMTSAEANGPGMQESTRKGREQEEEAKRVRAKRGGSGIESIQYHLRDCLSILI